MIRRLEFMYIFLPDLHRIQVNLNLKSVLVVVKLRLPRYNRHCPQVADRWGSTSGLGRYINRAA